LVVTNKQFSNFVPGDLIVSTRIEVTCVRSSF
jgi:hypothetical protein